MNKVMIEEVCFNHSKKRWGKNFSTVEIGKKMIDRFFENKGIEIEKRKGWETKALREKYGYRKIGNKSSDSFESHCCDSLSLAVEAIVGERVEPCKVIVVDDTYRCVRRRLYDSNIKKGGKLEAYSRGIVGGISKGVKIGMKSGKEGRLCGMDRGRWRYYDENGKRQTVKKLEWISREFITRTN